jgi:hypothetical protein
MTSTAVRVAPPTARQVRVRLRRARRGHHARSLGDFLTDAYVLLWFLLMYGWVLYSAGRRYLHTPSGGHGDAAERYWIGVATAVAAAGFAWRGLRAVGPLLVTPAAQAWAVSAPIDRRGWLLPRLGALLGSATAAVAVLGVAVMGLAGSSDGRDLAWAALAGAACGLGGAASSVAAQQTAGRRWPRLVGVALTGAGALAALAVVIAHFGGRHLARPNVPLAAAIAVVGPPLAVVAAALAVRVLPRLDRAALTTGANLATAAVTATVWMDPSLLAVVLEGRRWRGVGRVRSRRFRPGAWWWALLQAEVRRQFRHPSALATWASLVLAQYAVAVAVPSVAGVTHLIGAYLAAGRLSGGLRAVCRSAGLRRALGVSDAGLHMVHLVVPVLGTALWWLLTVPAGGLHLGQLEPVFVIGVVAAVYRAATRPPMSYGGAVVETPFGLIPVDLLRQLTRGPDVLAVLVIAQTLLT